MDGGNTSLWTASFNPILAPRSYLYTAKFGHLGTGLPYAIGAKLAAPDRPVYLISGDGAIGFNIQELETARRYDAADHRDRLLRPGLGDGALIADVRPV